MRRQRRESIFRAWCESAMYRGGLSPAAYEVFRNGIGEVWYS